MYDWLHTCIYATSCSVFTWLIHNEFDHRVVRVWMAISKKMCIPLRFLSLSIWYYWSDSCSGTTKRLAFVLELQKYMRVDSLGKCLHSKATGPEKPVSLGVGRTAKETLEMKREAISQYMFYLAFENTYERGYVTEKVFDALIAGVVPVRWSSCVNNVCGMRL